MKRPTKPPVKPSWDQAAVNPVPRLDGGAVLPASEVDGFVTYPKAEFPAGFIYENYTHHQSDPSLSLWHEKIGRPFPFVRDVLSRDLPPETEVRIFIHQSEVQVTINHPNKNYSDDRLYFLSEKRMGKGSTYVYPKHQAKGTGTTLLRNQIEFACLIGMTYLQDNAANEMGGWVWARKGFPLDVKDSSYLIKDMRDTLSERLKMIAGFGLKRLYPDIERWAKCRNRWDTGRIAHIDVPLIRPSDVEGHRRALQTRLLEILSPLSENVDPERLSEFVTIMKPFMKGQLFQRRQPVTVGQFLLIHSAWPIRIDFDDVTVMKRLGQTLGGWKYIDPGQADSGPENTPSGP